MEDFIGRIAVRKRQRILDHGAGLGSLAIQVVTLLDGNDRELDALNLYLGCLVIVLFLIRGRRTVGTPLRIVELNIRRIGEFGDLNGGIVIRAGRDLLDRYRNRSRVGLELFAQVIAGSCRLNLRAVVADGEGLGSGGSGHALRVAGDIDGLLPDLRRELKIGVEGDVGLDLCIQRAAFRLQSCDILLCLADGHIRNVVIEVGSFRLGRDAALRQDEGGEHLVLAGHGGRDGVNHIAAAGEQALDRGDVCCLCKLNVCNAVDILQLPDRRILGIGIGHGLGLDKPGHALIVLDHGVIGSAGAADLRLNDEIGLGRIPVGFRRAAGPIVSRAEQAVVKRLCAGGRSRNDGLFGLIGKESLDIRTVCFKVCGHLVDGEVRHRIDAFGILADVLLLDLRADLGNVVGHDADGLIHITEDHAVQRISVRIGEPGELLQRQLNAVLIVAVEAGISRVVKLDLGQGIGSIRPHHEFGHLALILACICAVDPFVLDFLPDVA